MVGYRNALVDLIMTVLVDLIKSALLSLIRSAQVDESGLHYYI
jgi:hypothetical protein